MRNAAASAVLLIGLAAAALVAGGCHRRPCGIIYHHDYHSFEPPNPNLVFGSDTPVMPPPGWAAAQQYAYDSRTLPPTYFPGAVDVYEIHTRDYARTPSDDRFSQWSYSTRAGSLYR
jgi:hypothetical protein